MNGHICAYHFVASTDENGYGPGVFALLDDQHVILCGAKGDLLYHTSCAKLLWCQLTEPWHDAASCGYGNQLQRKHTFDTGYFNMDNKNLLHTFCSSALCGHKM